MKAAWFVTALVTLMLAGPSATHGAVSQAPEDSGLAQLSDSEIEKLIDKLDQLHPCSPSNLEVILSHGSDGRVVAALRQAFGHERSPVSILAHFALYRISGNRPAMFEGVLGEMRAHTTCGGGYETRVVERELDDEVDSDLVPVIAKDLQSPDEWGRRLVAVWLLGPLARLPRVVATMGQAACDEDWHVRMRLADALENACNLHPELAGDPEVISILLELIADEDSSVRQNACAALAPHGYREDTINAIWGALKDDHVYVRCAAIRVLAKVAPQDEILPALLKLSRDPEVFIADAALEGLTNFDPQPRILTAICRSFIDRGYSIHTLPDRAAIYLQFAPPDTPQLPPLLMKFLSSKRTSSCLNASYALRALAGFRTDPQQSIPVILQYCDRSFVEKRYPHPSASGLVMDSALVSLSMVDPREEFVPVILELLDGCEIHPNDPLVPGAAARTDDSRLLEGCIRALSHYEDQAEDTVPRLSQLLESGIMPEYEPLIRAALFNLGHEREANLRKIMDGLDPDAPFHYESDYTYQALEMIGPDAAEALPLLDQMLCHDDREAREGARLAIAAIEGPPFDLDLFL